MSISTMPCASEYSAPRARMADGATVSAPGALSWREATRPTCMSCMHDLAALAVHRIGDLSPRADLSGHSSAKRSAVPLAVFARVGTLGNDQPGTGALGAVHHVQCGGRVIGVGTPARHGRHDDSVGKRQFAKLNGFAVMSSLARSEADLEAQR